MRQYIFTISIDIALFGLVITRVMSIPSIYIII